MLMTPRYYCEDWQRRAAAAAKRVEAASSTPQTAAQAQTAQQRLTKTLEDCTQGYPAYRETFARLDEKQQERLGRYVREMHDDATHSPWVILGIAWQRVMREERVAQRFRLNLAPTAE